MAGPAFFRHFLSKSIYMYVCSQAKFTELNLHVYKLRYDFFPTEISKGVRKNTLIAIVDDSIRDHDRGSLKQLKNEQLNVFKCSMLIS